MSFLQTPGTQGQNMRPNRLTDIYTEVNLVQALRDFLGGYCAVLSTSMKFGTDVDGNILNSFFEGAEAGAHWGHHICQIQDGRLPLFDLIITL